MSGPTDNDAGNPSNDKDEKGGDHKGGGGLRLGDGEADEGSDESDQGEKREGTGDDCFDERARERNRAAPFFEREFLFGSGHDGGLLGSGLPVRELRVESGAELICFVLLVKFFSGFGSSVEGTRKEEGIVGDHGDGSFKFDKGGGWFAERELSFADDQVKTGEMRSLGIDCESLLG